MKVHYVEFMFAGLFFSETSLKKVSQKDLKVKMPEGAFAYRRCWRTEVKEGRETLVGELHRENTIYYRHGELLDFKQLTKEYGKNSIVVCNMKYDEYPHVIRIGRGIYPFYKEDVNLPNE